jgi:hypothetical protein
MAVGLVSFAPVYLNGLLALLCIFLLPGSILVRAFEISNFPLRMLVALLGSLIANHFLVALIAALHLNPMASYRVVFFSLAALWAALSVADILRRRTPLGLHYNGAVAQTSDLLCLMASSALLLFAYRDGWASWPRIFADGDVAVSWNRWAQIWAAGQFPAMAFGYPQFVPTIWAVTYIFTGSLEHYFAFDAYIVLIFVPIVLVSAVLGRSRLSLGLVPVVAFAWLVLQIREPWLRSTLLEGFPDWVAAVAGLCGAVLFATGSPSPAFEREKLPHMLASLCLILIAAAIKPLYGLLAIVIMIRLCIDAAGWPDQVERRKFLIAAAAIFAGFAMAYLAYFVHLAASSMPHYPVTSLAERLLGAASQLNGNLGLPFRMVAGLGVIMAFFVPRIRWLAVPLLLGFLIWANTASYDLRNVLGFLAISAVIPLLVLEHTVTVGSVIPSEVAACGANQAGRKIPDGAVLATAAILSVCATFPLALSDARLRQRFNSEELRAGAGTELNQPLERFLARGCFVLSGAGYVFTLSSFAKYLPQMEFFHASLPLPGTTTEAFDGKKGCTGIVYPPDHSAETVLNYIKAKAEQRHYVTLGESYGWRLLASAP